MPVDGRYVAVVHVKTLAYILGQESITCVSKTEAAMTVCSLYNISLSEMYPSYDAVYPSSTLSGGRHSSS